MKSNKKNNQEHIKSQNRIGHGTLINGDITSNGGFRIDGTVIGNVKSEGKVVIGKEGKLEGALECVNADVEGSFKGKLQVTDLLSLKSTAKINGEVITKKLAVEPGAHFNATCVMNTGVKSITDNSKKEQTA